MLMSGSPATILLTQADSARAVATVYTVSLLATVPLVIVAILAFSLRRSSAEGRTLAWRSAIVALVVVFIGRQLPLHWMAWVVPSALAAPLVALGRVQVTGGSGILVQNAEGASVTFVDALLAIYVVGAAFVLVTTAIGMIIASLRLHRAIRVSGARWDAALAHGRTTLGVTRRGVRLFVDRSAPVPMTWGAFRPVIVLPAAAIRWSDEQLRIVLLHELGHVRANDWAFNLAARFACALYWFHPGVWWAARSLRDDCEIACDDSVIAAGIRRSDYAELLVDAASSVHRDCVVRSPAMALTRDRGLRGRIAAVLDVRHDVRPLRRGWAAVATLGTLGVAGPVSAVQLAPTREVLTTLMSDSRWESRAYAVLGLAQRPDSVAVARSAAELDPNPHVRAWARYALGQRPSSDLRSVLPDEQ
jgi:beta-lactamase regulating signal transducer with metallopeptidase domain